MIEILEVGFRTPHGDHLPAGQLAFDMDTGVHEFRYHEAYLEQGISLCPGQLAFDRTQQGSQAALNVFRGALPDRWGMNLLARALPRSMQSLPYMFAAIHTHALGALTFEGALVDRVKQAVSELGRDVRLMSPVEIHTLADAVLQLQDGMQKGLPPALQKLLVNVTSPGGARPKCLVHDTHGQWLAKFPDRTDKFDYVGLEYAAMRCAGEAGLQVPELRLEPLNSQRYLLVKRFDVAGEAGRKHMVSMASMLGVNQQWYQKSYRDIADVLAEHSVAPEVDLPQMFRQMVFNTMIGNTDDHLHNFMMLNDGHGYRLSPVFDILPNVGENLEHVLFFEYDGYTPNRSAIDALSKRFKLSPVKAQQIVDEVASAVSCISGYFEEAEVPPAESEQFSHDIQQRVAQVLGKPYTAKASPKIR